jgi:cytochrome c oxidase subunit 1
MPKEHYLNADYGVRSWLLTIDHKRIAILYLIAVTVFFALGGLMAVLIRVELATPQGDVFHADVYNRLFTMHGIFMIFFFLIPAVPGVLGNFLLPLMIGARDVAFPRLNLASWYLYVIGGLFSFWALLNGGIDTGWTFYTPLSTMYSNTHVITVGLGIFINGFSSILTGVNFVVTIHKLRAPGLTWFRLPLFVWSLYATSIIFLLGTPVLAITVLLLAGERLFQVGIFDPRLGGDPVLFQHFFWFYSHPAVYIMILPAMGIISEVISIHARKHIFGYRFIALSSIAIAAFGFLVWGHHMFVSGQSGMANAIFSALTFSVAIPSAIKVFNWLATLYKGDIRLNTAMIYGLMFIITFGIGGLTGLHLGALAVDVHLHDTYFVVAHFHYVMFGGTVIAFLAGLHHWWPKMFGVMFDERLGRIGAALVFIGFNTTFFTQFVMGSHGMPRRYYDYLPQFTIYHRISTVGSYVMAAGFFLIAYYLLRSLFRGATAPMNPWGGNSLEWHTASPPPHDNFAVTPVAEDPYAYGELVEDAVRGTFTSRTYEGAGVR